MPTRQALAVLQHGQRVPREFVEACCCLLGIPPEFDS